MTQEAFIEANRIMNEWLHDQHYIYFKNKKIVDSKKLHKREFYDLVEELSHSYTQIQHTTVISKFKKGCFALTEKEAYLRLTWRDEKGKWHQRFTNFKDDKKNDVQKGSALTKVTKEFKERTGAKFNEVFGEVGQHFKRCVPGLFHYDREQKATTKARIEAYLTKLDFSSHFPACACGSLPDANTAMVIKGWAEPTEEYPFAFYIHSGFVAEYGKYNSRNWWDSPFREELFQSPDRKYTVSPKDSEETILMKAAQYNLEPEMQYYYQLKLHSPRGSKEREDAKLVLLKIIGQMEQNNPMSYNGRPYAHLAAVIKARAIHKMLELIGRIGFENVVTVIVDGIICNNEKKIHYGDAYEFLGSLQEEFFQAVGRFRGHNQYVLIEGDKQLITHAGFDINVESLDPMQWQRSPAMHIREEITQGLNLIIEDLNDEKEIE